MELNGKGYETMNDRIAHVMREMEAQDKKERAQGLPPSQRMRAIEPSVGQFLFTLARAMKAQRMVEVGTSRGYSSLWLGAAAQANGGGVTTFEIDSARAATARENHARAGLDQVVRVVEGDAAQGIANLSGPFDLIFLDAEKRDYISQFQAAWGKVRVGGLVIADNVISHSQELAEYVAYVRVLPNAMSMTIEIGRGAEVTLRLR